MSSRISPRPGAHRRPLLTPSRQRITRLSSRTTPSYGPASLPSGRQHHRPHPHSHFSLALEPIRKTKTPPKDSSGIGFTYRNSKLFMPISTDSRLTKKVALGDFQAGFSPILNEVQCSDSARIQEGHELSLKCPS